MKLSIEWRVFCLILLLSLAVRLPNLGYFMTADEPVWMVRSGEFWNNLWLDRDPGGTFQSGHPGVITMWTAGAGIFAQEMRSGFRIDTSNLAHFRYAALLPVVILTSVLIGLAALFVYLLAGMWPALGAGIFLALDPYLIGMSQIVHVDMILGLCMINALLAFLLFIRDGLVKDRRASSGWFRLPVIAAIFWGMALLNKFWPALFLGPVFASLLWFFTTGSVFIKLRAVVRSLGFMTGVSALMLFGLWPTMWVGLSPVRYLVQDAVSVTTERHADVEVGGEVATRFFYFLTVLARVPWISLILAVLFGAAMLWSWRYRRDPGAKFVGVVFLFALGFLLFISVPAKQADRYAVPSLIALALTAGWGAGFLWRARVGPGALVALVLVLIWQSALFYPYQIAYSNTWLDWRPLHQQGWGEGLDDAARYLNDHPLGAELTVASWYPSVLESYFQGKSFSLSSRHDVRVGYVVLYRNMLGRGFDEEASDIWRDFADKEPAYIAYVGGLPYAYVFDTLTIRYFPKHGGEILSGGEVGQTVKVHRESWGAVEVGLANFSGRANAGDIIVRIKTGPDATDDLRTIRKRVSDIADHDWNRFDFDPIDGAAGRDFYVSVTTEGASVGNAPAVFFSPIDIREGEFYLRREASDKPMSDFRREGDMALRIN